MNIKILKLLTLYIISVSIYFGYYLVEEKIIFSIPNYVIGLLPVSIFLYGYITLINSAKLISKKNYSSKLTSICKYYIPLTNAIWFVFNLLTYSLNLYTSEDIGIVTICFQFVSIILSIPFTQLKLLFIGNNEIIIYDYSKTMNFKIKEIIKIKQVLFLFAIIEIERDQVKHRYIIMPPLDEFWYLNYFRETNSVKEIKAKIFN